MISTAIVAEELTMAGMQAMPMTGGQAGIKVNSNFGNGDIQTIDTAVFAEAGRKRRHTGCGGISGP
jgi:aspartate kinase